MGRRSHLKDGKGIAAYQQVADTTKPDMKREIAESINSQMRRHAPASFSLGSDKAKATGNAAGKPGTASLLHRTALIDYLFVSQDSISVRMFPTNGRFVVGRV